MRISEPSHRHPVPQVNSSVAIRRNKLFSARVRGKAQPHLDVAGLILKPRRPAAFLCGTARNSAGLRAFKAHSIRKESDMKKILLIAATTGALAAPAMAEDVGVQVGPVGAGVTVGQGHRDYDRDRVREKTVIKEHEPADHTTVIKKEHGDGSESKTVIHRDY